MDKLPVEIFSLHGATFTSHVRPATGSSQLCAWEVGLPAGQAGAAHRVSHEEVLLVLSGTPTSSVDERRTLHEAGDVIFVPAGAAFCLDNTGADVARLWVTTSVGLRASLADGTVVSPPWVG